MDPVLVVWEDAYDLDAEIWNARGEQEAPEPCLVKQVGFILWQDEHRVVLTSGFTDDMVMRRFVIPNGMIRSITMLYPFS